MDSSYQPKGRHKISSPDKDKRVFSHTADQTHKANAPTGNPKRGGIRL